MSWPATLRPSCGCSRWPPRTACSGPRTSAVRRRPPRSRRRAARDRPRDRPRVRRLVPGPGFWHPPRGRQPAEVGQMKAWAAAMVALASASVASVQAADLADVKARGVLRVIIMPLQPKDEFFAYPPGPKPGFDREVLDGFARLHKITLDVVPVEGWDNLIPALLEGKG